MNPYALKKPPNKILHHAFEILRVTFIVEHIYMFCILYTFIINNLNVLKYNDDYLEFYTYLTMTY